MDVLFRRTKWFNYAFLLGCMFYSENYSYRGKHHPVDYPSILVVYFGKIQPRSWLYSSHFHHKFTKNRSIIVAIQQPDSLMRASFSFCLQIWAKVAPRDQPRELVLMTATTVKLPEKSTSLSVRNNSFARSIIPSLQYVRLRVFEQLGSTPTPVIQRPFYRINTDNQIQLVR